MPNINTFWYYFNLILILYNVEISLIYEGNYLRFIKKNTTNLYYSLVNFIPSLTINIVS